MKKNGNDRIKNRKYNILIILLMCLVKMIENTYSLFSWEDEKKNLNEFIIILLLHKK